MFVRRKTIKGKPYAYLVENTWSAGRTRQKVRAYLGRVEILSDDEEPIGMAFRADTFRNNMHALIEEALGKHGFFKTERRLEKGDFIIDIDSLDVRKNGKSIVLGINRGHLCSHTLKQLMMLAPDGQGNGQELAHALHVAGLPLTPESFVSLHESSAKEKATTNEQPAITNPYDVSQYL